MVQITQRAQQLVAEIVQPGEAVIDATCGNGHDTRFLVELVGEQGEVVACDLQPIAIEKTRLHCADLKNIQYQLGNHGELLEMLRQARAGKIAAVMFNLGYLPGGEKELTTESTSTLVAIRASWQLLRAGGMLSVVAYVGHPGGRAEADAVELCLGEWLRNGQGQVAAWPAPAIERLSPRLYALIKVN